MLSFRDGFERKDCGKPPRNKLPINSLPRRVSVRNGTKVPGPRIVLRRRQRPAIRQAVRGGGVLRLRRRRERCATSPGSSLERHGKPQTVKRGAVDHTRARMAGASNRQPKRKRVMRHGSPPTCICRLRTNSQHVPVRFALGLPRRISAPGVRHTDACTCASSLGTSPASVRRAPSAARESFPHYAAAEPRPLAARQLDERHPVEV